MGIGERQSSPLASASLMTILTAAAISDGDHYAFAARVRDDGTGGVYVV